MLDVCHVIPSLCRKICAVFIPRKVAHHVWKIQTNVLNSTSVSQRPTLPIGLKQRKGGIYCRVPAITCLVFTKPIVRFTHSHVISLREAGWQIIYAKCRPYLSGMIPFLNFQHLTNEIQRAVGIRNAIWVTYNKWTGLFKV